MNEIAYGLVRTRDLASLLDDTLPERLRIPVARVVALVAEGQMTESILGLYPDLEADDVREALLFAAEAVRERAQPLAASE
jgi:hypothetical protein